jgi:hypothetical protein
MQHVVYRCSCCKLALIERRSRRQRLAAARRGAGAAHPEAPPPWRSRLMTDLPEPAAVADLPVTALPAVLAKLAAAQAHLAAVQDAVAARLATDALHPERPASDEWLDVAAAAALVGHSVSWMRKHGDRLPGFHQATGRGGKVRWLRAALRTWNGVLASQTADRR